ncbi:lysophospholipid acyltransferase family protein [Pseudoxanthomonas winnipegensis]|uniref:L-ornithine N(alpha)-acyltransferase n=1 Tax=Pseudoxanthomonas winnipegensis TaxID=2480810 RepID=A0A4Q8LLF8_9GAMM|nr:GNAT family N-acyltransferase [Pseudoxanthomonas winnipegensis]RZZ86263.1 GNAT family N-acetyltransferase [Pseudoxanthomonas winnipegensis]TAA31400.1 GNAT family N-acetyltransferase [Pseudoxanthomonas winnipegensis]TAA41279.1 GNAT family N-acetyltransferase [Pseudoxanthomonas winnipegensis]TBV77196.1 GNAT family N-acetyltransferase [Pseudoxanthomonas winnipegensis]
MRPLEDTLLERYPRWFGGRRGLLTRPLLRRYGHWSGLDQALAFLNAHRDSTPWDFVAAAQDFLQLDGSFDAQALARIPASGPLLVVANHPSGARDAMALLHLVGQVRRDVRIVANAVLTHIAPLRPLLLPVRVFGGSSAAGSLRAVRAALDAGQCVIVFPAGEVSRLSPLGVRDTRWRPGFVRFARASGAQVLPVRVQARNSALFYGASAVFKPAGTVLLPREMFARRQQPLRLYVGQAQALATHADETTVLRQLRRALYSLGSRADAGAESPAALVAPVPVAQLRAAIAALPSFGRTSEGRRIVAGPLAADSPLLREIGRLRELTFRKVGEGTGRALDVDDYDTWYDHIVLWDEEAGAVAGAYRVARGAQVLARRGLAGLYTASLFDWSEGALPRIAQGMELGRSFVAPDYWNSRSIDQLWQGIGAYLVAHPQVRYLFGAVSMSAALPQAAREQIVAYYQRFHGQDAGATARHPFVLQAVPAAFETLDAQAAFAVLRENLAALGAQVPMLFRQYTELCEPGGARFLAFGVDADFAGCVDGLIELDLERMHTRKRQRYLHTPTQEQAA